MKAIIIEDEKLTAQRLLQLLTENAPQIEVLVLLPSVKKATEWIAQHAAPDLVFLDIQLNDGTGFDVLDQWENHPPVIFTTAYDEYAIKGFKYNSLEYLLKPIVAHELRKAIEKVERLAVSTKPAMVPLADLKKWMQKEFKKRFMVKVGDQYKMVAVEETAYFFSQEGMAFLVGQLGKKWPIDYTLDQLEEILDPTHFFRINRKFILSVASITTIHSYFNSRLLLQLKPNADEEVIVSRERVAAFKQWLDM